MQLTAMDIQQFINNPSGIALDSLASKVVVAFTSGGFNLNESAIAADIFRLLLRDAEKSVRITLAEHLYDNLDAPHDVIFKLACDEIDVSEKILQHSLVLTDDDLVSIVESTKEVLNLCAIAKRNIVSERLSDALIDRRQEAILTSLFNNKGAELSEKGLTKAWDMIVESTTLLEVLVKRGGLPLTVAEKIFSSVSGELKNHIASQYKLSPSVVRKASVDAREWELLGILPIEDIDCPDCDERVEDLVEQLYMTGRLTHSLVIRALCMGCLNLFESSLARMADIPRANARILLMGGSEGFRALYKTSNMPDGFVDAVEALLGITHKITEYGHTKPKDFRKEVIENIYVGGYNRSVDGMGYLLSIIDGKISGNYSSFSVH
jgi:uncharacterized protein (DUF2336 family)